MAMNIEDGTVTIHDGVNVANMQSNVTIMRTDDSLQDVQPLRKPEFFLYTKLNQNDTKTLKKSKTNTEERRTLAQIFNLSTINECSPTQTPNNIELLKLDFHYMNYEFCKKR